MLLWASQGLGWWNCEWSALPGTLKGFLVGKHVQAPGTSEVRECEDRCGFGAGQGRPMLRRKGGCCRTHGPCPGFTPLPVGCEGFRGPSEPSSAVKKLLAITAARCGGGLRRERAEAG